MNVNQLDHVKSTVPIRGRSCVIVLHDPLNVAVSCGSGTRMDHVPEVNAVPAEQSVVVGVVNVIPEFPPQSPDHPVILARFHDHAPAPTISCKSTHVIVTVAAVMVLCVLKVSDFINNLYALENPFRVSVFETVIFHPLTVIESWNPEPVVLVRL